MATHPPSTSTEVAIALKVLVSIYYLELNDRSQFRAAGSGLEELGGQVRLVNRQEWQFPQQMYREVGRPLQWTDRLVWTDSQWQEYAAKPSLSMFELLVNGQSAGYFELDQTDGLSVQIAYFGLLPAFVGRRLGGPLLAQAVKHSWTLGAERIWLHTCTLDHYHALPNYLSRGFAHYATRTVEKHLDTLPPTSLAAQSPLNHPLTEIAPPPGQSNLPG